MAFDFKQIDWRRVAAERRQAVQPIEVWLILELGRELLSKRAFSSLLLRLFRQPVLEEINAIHVDT